MQAHHNTDMGAVHSNAFLYNNITKLLPNKYQRNGIFKYGRVLNMEGSWREGNAYVFPKMRGEQQVQRLESKTTKKIVIK